MGRPPRGQRVGGEAQWAPSSRRLLPGRTVSLFVSLFVCLFVLDAADASLRHRDLLWTNDKRQIPRLSLPPGRVDTVGAK